MKKSFRKWFYENFDLHRSTNGWIRFENPFDSKAMSKHDATMAVSFETGIVKCFRTGYKEHIQTFVKEYTGLPIKEVYGLMEEDNLLQEDNPIKTYRETPTTGVSLPEEFIPLRENHGVVTERIWRYLEDERGLDVDALADKGWGYCLSGEWMGYIIVPFYIGGRIQYFLGRTFNGNARKYKNPKTEEVNVGAGDIFYNEDALDYYETVYITESVFNAETWGDDCVASLGWALKQQQMYKLLKSPVKNLIIIPDRDFVRKAMATFLKIYDKKNILVYDVDKIPGKYKDLNEWGKDYLKEKAPLIPVNFSSL